ncbi:MAG: hypothetical protein ACTSU5_19355, partial [Promethearchaeota archaeon]
RNATVGGNLTSTATSGHLKAEFTDLRVWKPCEWAISTTTGTMDFRVTQGSKPDNELRVLASATTGNINFDYVESGGAVSRFTATSSTGTASIEAGPADDSFQTLGENTVASRDYRDGSPAFSYAASSSSGDVTFTIERED